MRRCENCVHARCRPSPLPRTPDVWECEARGGMVVLHPVARALTCVAYEYRYRLQGRKNEQRDE